ncbi:MAG: social motility TPR repeat lipoprotein Tgl [Deltaproteobacteria bacterium]
MPRIFPSLALALALALTGCGPSAHDLENAQIHYDLGVNAMELQHDPQSALKDLEAAVQANPNMEQAQNALGLVYHMMLHRPEEAVPHYLRALELDPKDSEAANNLGAAYTDLGRYADAARMFQRALADELYRTPYIAEGNLGWVLYKEGDVQAGLQHLENAVRTNPAYCQGYRSLGMIDAEQGKLEAAEREFTRFHDKCPNLPESSYRLGLVLLKEGRDAQAREQLRACAEAKGAKDTDLGAECGRLLKLMQ